MKYKMTVPLVISPAKNRANTKGLRGLRPVEAETIEDARNQFIRKARRACGAISEYDAGVICDAVKPI